MDSRPWLRLGEPGAMTPPVLTAYGSSKMSSFPMTSNSPLVLTAM